MRFVIYWVCFRYEKQKSASMPATRNSIAHRPIIGKLIDRRSYIFRRIRDTKSEQKVRYMLLASESTSNDLSSLDAKTKSA